MDLTVYWLRWSLHAVCLLLVCRVSGVSVRCEMSWEQLKSVYLWAAVALAQTRHAYRACLCVTDECRVLLGMTGSSCSWRRFTMCSTCPAWTRRPAASPSTLACRYWYQRDSTAQSVWHRVRCCYINTHTRLFHYNLHWIFYQVNDIFYGLTPPLNLPITETCAKHKNLLADLYTFLTSGNQ